jgi:diacylglycerol kinase family enzyme
MITIKELKKELYLILNTVIMKAKEFYQERKIEVVTDQGTFEFSSYAEMLGNFNDITNRETWANAHHSEDGESCVFVAHRFDTIGKIVENHMSHDEAEEYAKKLNEYFAICEEYNVIEL